LKKSVSVFLIGHSVYCLALGVSPFATWLTDGAVVPRFECQSGTVKTTGGGS